RRVLCRHSGNRAHCRSGANRRRRLGQGARRRGQAIALPMELVGRSLVKRHPGVLALDRVSVAFSSGEIHAVVGENGAGKSTLMNILCGASVPDEGTLILDGAPVAFA